MTSRGSPQVWKQLRPGWRSPAHTQLWLSSLERYAVPRIGKMPISEVTSADVIGILAPIWHDMPPTARKLRQRIRAVMEWAVAMGLRPDNPCDRIGPVLGSQGDVVRHMRAVPHGFRSSFRDWAAEETDHLREVIEAALAHVVQNRVEAAYRRTDLFEHRRRLMEQRPAGQPGSHRTLAFGARWPGLVWTDQTILSKPPPRQTDDPDVSDDERKPTGDAPVGNWTWRRAAPRIWEPTYAERGTTRKIVLHIHNPVYGDKIYRATDTYPAGSYDCKTRTTVLCTGEGGIVY